MVDSEWLKTEIENLIKKYDEVEEKYRDKVSSERSIALLDGKQYVIKDLKEILAEYDFGV
jgi:uncharacterized protein YacL (UPF0231 family)